MRVTHGDTCPAVIEDQGHLVLGPALRLRPRRVDVPHHMSEEVLGHSILINRRTSLSRAVSDSGGGHQLVIFMGELLEDT